MMEDESLPLADAEEGQTPSENDEEKPKAEFKKPGGVKVMITGPCKETTHDIEH